MHLGINTQFENAKSSKLFRSKATQNGGNYH